MPLGYRGERKLCQISISRSLCSCDFYDIVSDAVDATQRVLAADGVAAGREYLWTKARWAWRYAWTNYGTQVDWFIKLDDDSNLVVENAKKMLAAYDDDVPLYRVSQKSSLAYLICDKFVEDGVLLSKSKFILLASMPRTANL